MNLARQIWFLLALGVSLIVATLLFPQTSPPSPICVPVSGLPPPGNQISFTVKPNALDFGTAAVGSSAPARQICISTNSPSSFYVSSGDQAQFPVSYGPSFDISNYLLVNIGFTPKQAKALAALVSVMPVSGTTQYVQVTGQGTLPATPLSITAVVNAASFQSTVAANTYITIYGQNLSTTNPGRSWTSTDFTLNPDKTLSLPTSLDGTSVTVNGVAAYVEYISPGQVNAIVPDITATGSGVQVMVTVNGQSTVFGITTQSIAPALFADQKYVVAQHADFSLVGKVGLYPHSTPAVPGETIIVYGTGFGPTTPPIKPGIVTDKTYNLVPTPTAFVGYLPATVTFAGLIPNLAQVYQANVTIPANAPNGDHNLMLTINGTESYPGLITVQK